MTSSTSSKNVKSTNYIFLYYQQIQDGTVNVGKWIRLWYSLIIKNLEAKVYVFDPKAANHALGFIENYCRHHEGDLAPNRIVLEVWQKAFISVIFGIKDKDGYRQFREVLLVIGRKNGKTLLAAAIAAYCAYKDGEYGGRVYMVAPKLAQANLCFNGFYQMVKKEPALDKRAKKRRTDVYIEQSNTSIAPLAFSAQKSDGLNCSLVIADELASWGGDNGLKFYEVLKSSFGARKQPLLLSITTAGYINNSIYDELFIRCTRVILGDSQETRLAPFLYMIDDIDNWNSIDELAKANPNLGVSISVDYLIEEIRIAEGSLSKKAETLTKYANIKQNSSQAWLSSKAIANASGEEITLESIRSSYVVLGIDLSQTTDLSSVSILCQRNGKLNIINHFWLPSAKLEEATARDGIPYKTMIDKGFLSLSGEGFVDYKDIYEYIVMLIREYEILPLMVGYDRYSAKYLINELEQSGIRCDDVYQGFNLYPAIQELEGSLNSNEVNIGNNDLLKVHLLDTALMMDSESRRARIVKVSSKVHIDGTAAILCALIVKQKWFAEIGEQLKNEG